MLRHRFDREILRLAGPAFITLLAEPLYLLTDTAVVGHLGTAQLGGLAVASAILLTGHSLCIFLAYGTTAAVARMLGAGDKRSAADQAVQGLWLGLAVGVVLSALVALGSETLVDWLGAEADVAASALVYLRISLVGFPFLLVTLAGTGYLRGLQDTRTPLLVALGTVAANLAIEVVLIYGFDQGIGASALATVIAQGGGAVVYVRTVVRAASRDGARLRPDPAAQRRLIRVGLDLIVRTVALRASLVALTAVATRLGEVEVAAHVIAFEVWNLTAMGLDSLAIAGQAMVGRYLGAGSGEEARAASWRLLQLGVMGGAVVGLALAALSPFLGRVFSPDPAVVALAGFLLLWVAVLQPLGAVAFVLDGVLIGAGDQRFLARAMLGAAVALGAVLAVVVRLDLGMGWVWLSFGTLMAVRSLTLVVRFRGDSWVVLGRPVR